MFLLSGQTRGVKVLEKMQNGSTCFECVYSKADSGPSRWFSTSTLTSLQSAAAQQRAHKCIMGDYPWIFTDCVSQRRWGHAVFTVDTCRRRMNGSDWNMWWRSCPLWRRLSGTFGLRATAAKSCRLQTWLKKLTDHFVAVVVSLPKPSHSPFREAASISILLSVGTSGGVSSASESGAFSPFCTASRKKKNNNRTGISHRQPHIRIVIDTFNLTSLQYHKKTTQHV